MRIKDTDVDGTKHKIASLTYDQVEVFFPQGQASAKGEATVKGHTCPVVAASLNNVAIGNGKWFNGDIDFEAPALTSPAKQTRTWSAKDISAEFDFAEIMGLYTAITQFSGLRTIVTKDALKTDGAPEGEAKAAA